MKVGKYKNKRAVVDGVTFHSQGEYRRWLELRALENMGALERLDRQVRLPLVIDGTKVGTWVADFRYFQNNRTVFEDYKSRFTAKLPEWRFKERVIRALYRNAEIRVHIGGQTR